MSPDHNIQPDLETIKLTEKFCDMRMVDEDDVNDYLSDAEYRVVKMFGEETNSPRFLVGRVRADELDNARQEISELRSERNDANYQASNLRRQVSDAERNEKRARDDEAYWREEHSKLVMQVEGLRTRCIEFETHVGILRREVGPERSKELLGK